MRTRENFDQNWTYIIDEIGPLPKTYAKSGIVGGVSNAVDGELFEPFAGAANMLKRIQDVLPAGDDAKGDLDVASMLMGDLPEKARSARNWLSVNLPHDFRLELGYSDGLENWSQGYIKNGVAYYRKTFKIPKSDLGKRIILEFDGVMRNSSFWYNGCFIGDHYSGYTGFQFDLTELTKFGDEEGDNVILVRCDTTNGDEGWWYEGGGIYRHTWLTKCSSLHVDRWGVFVKPVIESEKVTLDIETTICNEESKTKNYIIKTSIYNPGGEEVACVEQDGSIAPFSKNKNKIYAKLKDALFWDCDHPNLYLAITEVFCEGKLVDNYDTSFGIREVEYTKEGFLLNGKLTPLFGTCFHQDFIGVGVAIPDAIHQYKINKIKELGFNAFRSSHNPVPIELMEMCDKLGILVINENRIIETSRHRVEDLEEMVKSSRNSPSVFAYALSNEEVFAGSYQALRILDKLIPYVKHLDDSRLLISAEAFLTGEMAAKYGLELYDVFGMNYPESFMNNDQFKRLDKTYPDMKIMATESASWYTTRGIYKDNKHRGHCSSYGSKYVMMGGEGGPNAGGTAKPWETWSFYKNNPSTGGFFVWTGFDYRGEPTPLREYQVSSNFGIMDTCGFPKDDYYYYKALLDENPVLHIMPHWCWGEHNGSIKVRIYTNCEEVELFLNERSLGKKSLDNDWIEFEVDYKPGELMAVGYKDEVEVTRQLKKTAGQAKQIKLDVDRSIINADGRDVACIEVSVVDNSGVIVPEADNEIEFEVVGEGSLIGLGNGDPGSRESERSYKMRVFSGLALALVQSSEQPGSITIRAMSRGLMGAELTIESKSF